MCLVDSTTSIDISSDLSADEYCCNDCNTRFKGMGTRIRCPACMSKNVRKL